MIGLYKQRTLVQFGVATNFEVESMPGIIRGTSQLDPDVPLSRHPAPDILKLYGFCSCECNHDKTRVLPLDF